MSLAILLTWIYSGNRRTTLSAILVHFMSNTSWTLVAGLGKALPARLDFCRAVAYSLAAAVVLLGRGVSDAPLRSR